MGIFGKLKDVFSGGGRESGSDGGLYVYVKLDRSSEVVRLRLEPQFELLPDYDDDDRLTGYTSRKLIVGPRTYKRADAVFYFNRNRQLTSADITGGELTDETAFNSYEESLMPGDPETPTKT